MRTAARAGMLRVVVKHQIGTIPFGVPIEHAPLDKEELENYERQVVDAICAAIADFSDVTLFDCGADIGAFSALVCSKSKSIGRVIAFEPNPNTRDVVARNISWLPVQSQLVTKAVSNFEGNGRLESPSSDPADVARFLVPGEGPVQVTTVDSMQIRGGDIAIKIDVEGGELNVLKGASETIRAARACALTIEAHPEVSKRTRQDPVECLTYLESLRPFSYRIAETGTEVWPGAPVIKSGQTAVWNIVARSKG
jgi:FkbM family methyltransferase